MNKRIFTFLMVSILAGLLCTSCKDDEEALASKIGVLSGDDAEANVRVKDVRLISVGNYWYGFNPFWKYSYTNFGKLNSFSSTDYMTADVDGSKIIMNALFPMLVTLLGMVTLLRLVQPSNRWSSILPSRSGSVTEVSAVQLEKAYLPISKMVMGKEMLVRE